MQLGACRTVSAVSSLSRSVNLEAKLHHRSENTHQSPSSSRLFLTISHPDHTSRPLLKELNSSNTESKDADDRLDRAEDQFRIHVWLPDRI